MVELVKTMDPIRLSFLRALLKDAHIEVYVLDEAAPWPGAIPVRVMVANDDEAAARRVLEAHGEMHD